MAQTATEAAVSCGQHKTGGFVSILPKGSLLPLGPMLINPGAPSAIACVYYYTIKLRGLAVLGFEKFSLASSIKITLGGL